MEDSVKRLIETYLKVQELTDNKQESISLGMKVKNEMQRMLDNSFLESNVFKIDFNVSIDENYLLILDKVKNRSHYEKHEHECKIYIEYLMNKKLNKEQKLNLKNKIKEKIKNYDPMLFHYLEYLMSVKKARNRLDSHFVNESLETISNKYNELEKMI